MPRKLTGHDISRYAPVGPVLNRRAHTLPIEQVHPVIRIAHRQSSAVNIKERIIFDHEIVLIQRGGGRVEFREETLSLSPHTLLVIPPYVPHSFHAQDSAGGAGHVAVHFDLAPGFPAFANQLKRRPAYEVRLSHGLSLPRATLLPANHPIEQHLDAIVDTFASDTPTASLECSSLLLQVILQLLRQPQDNASQSDAEGAAAGAANRVRLERAIAYAQGNYHLDLAVADLADAAGLSASHFSRLFRQWIGRSPSQYLRELRIDRARELLAHNVDLSIKEIARQTGFKDQYHFSKVFRQIDGLTPTLYREAALAGGRHDRDSSDRA